MITRQHTRLENVNSFLKESIQWGSNYWTCADNLVNIPILICQIIWVIKVPTENDMVFLIQTLRLMITAMMVTI